MSSIHRRTYTWVDADGVRQTGTRYQAAFHTSDGRRFRKQFERKRDAQTWLDEQAASAITGMFVDPRAGKQKVSAYAEQWLSRQVGAPNTLDDYERFLRLHLVPELGRRNIGTVTRADVQKLVRKWIDGGAKPTTVGGRYSKLAILMRSAVKDRVIAATPCHDITLPRTQARSALVPIDTKTVVAIRAAMPARYRALVTVLAGTGLRRGEGLGLTKDRLDPERRQIRIDQQLSRATRADEVVFSAPKTDASVRTVDAAPFVFDAIAEHIEEYGVHEEGLIFTTEHGSPISTSNLQRVWSRAAEKAETTATPHDLRHYFASMQLAGGCSIKKLQALLGHKSAVETWDTYGHLIGDEDDRARTIMETSLGEALRIAAPTVPQEAA